MAKAKKQGRPKGSRNKDKFYNYTLSDTIEVGSLKTKTPWMAPTEPPTFLSRLEAATVKYEQAINDAITALKG